MNRLLCFVAVAALAMFAAAFGVHAQPQYGASVAGRFDYYLLSLSWSPSYCAEDGMADRDPRQCGRDRWFTFVVHGLWPQNERGWPSGCASRQVRPSPALVASMLDIMPSARLVSHEWETHGQCSGLSAQAYFDLTRRVRAGVRIPTAFAAPTRTLMVTGAEVERAYVAANPNFTPAMIAVQCDRSRLREIRICVTRDGRPRACGGDVRDRCSGGRVAMPPVRAGR